MEYEQMMKEYFRAANAHDEKTMLQFFAADAVVFDEGETHQGRDAIGEWIKQTNAKYQTQHSLVDIAIEGNDVAVVASVSGTFPGSPIRLTSRFTIEDGKISQLQCGG